MKKYLLDLRVKSVEQIHQRYVLIKLTDEKPLPEMLPGQFVEIRVDGSPNTFLRRPISINFVDEIFGKNITWHYGNVKKTGAVLRAALSAAAQMPGLPAARLFSRPWTYTCCGQARERRI